MSTNKTSLDNGQTPHGLDLESGDGAPQSCSMACAQLDDCTVVLRDMFHDIKNSLSHTGYNIKSCFVDLHDIDEMNITLPPSQVRPCNHPRCLTCGVLNNSIKFQSTFTNKSYFAQSHTPMSCNTGNVIYLVTCKKCGLQYVGKTEQYLKRRVSGHRTTIKRKEKYFGQHFSSNDHSLDDYSIQIIEKVYDVQGETNHQFTKRILEKERFWIRELGTLWPYGLNDNLAGYGNVSQKHEEGIASLFHHNKRRPRGHGHKKYNSKSIHDYVTINYLKDVWENNGLHHIKSILYSLPHAILYKLHGKITIAKSLGHLSDQLYYIIADSCYCRLFSPVKTIGNPVHRHFLKLKYINRGIDAIHLANIFHETDVINTIPPYFSNTLPPLISYSYTSPIGPKIFNFSKTVKEFDMSSYLDMTCDCHLSPYQYTPHGHIITGDHSFVQDPKLRTILTKGPKFREQENINWDDTKTVIYEALDTYARLWAKKENSDVIILNDWLDSIKTIIEKRIILIKDQLKRPPYKVLKDKNVTKYLDNLQSRFVLVPADKASNNIIIVCKKFYYTVLIKELQIGENNTNATYQPVNITLKEIVDKHVLYLLKHTIALSEKEKDLPRIYWTPKLHKDPYKFRFIAGSRHCSTKKVSIYLTKGLECIKHSLVAYCSAIYNNSGIDCMWILKNSQELLESLKSGCVTDFKCVTSWDFSTLYTTIEHQDLKNKIIKMIKKFFPFGKHMNISDRKAFFSDKDQKGYIKFYLDSFIDIFEFLIDNIYIVFGESVYRQVIGIPMGTNCAPLLADLYLSAYEFEFVQNLMSSKRLYLARQFNHTYRYIDDLISINNPNFAVHVHDIYPPFLELKNVTDSDDGTSYLDLYLHKGNSGELKTKLYDKRDDFDFTIVNYPFMDSNIPKCPAYGVYVSRLVAFARACSVFGDFFDRHLHLAKKLCHQGFSKSQLQKTFVKFAQNHENLVSKYQIDLQAHIKQILDNC